MFAVHGEKGLSAPVDGLRIHLMGEEQLTEQCDTILAIDKLSLKSLHNQNSISCKRHSMAARLTAIIDPSCMLLSSR